MSILRGALQESGWGLWIRCCSYGDYDLLDDGLTAVIPSDIAVIPGRFFNMMECPVGRSYIGPRGCDFVQWASLEKAVEYNHRFSTR